MLSLLSLYLLSECGGQGDQPPSGDLHLRPGVQRVLQHQGHTPLLKVCVWGGGAGSAHHHLCGFHHRFTHHRQAGAAEYETSFILHHKVCSSSKQILKLIHLVQLSHTEEKQEVHVRLLTHHDLSPSFCVYS